MHGLPWSTALLVCAATASACSGGTAQLAVSAPPPTTASASAASAASAEPSRPGLGTAWGESVHSPMSFAPFERASDQPWAQVTLHYNDLAGTAAHAEYIGAGPEPLEADAGWGAMSVALIDDAGEALPGFRAADRNLIVGESGERYRIAVHNHAPVRFEIVASVDGLDVIDGQPADPARRGYLIDPHGTLIIDGFRTSSERVAAFRFGRVDDAYATRTTGDRNVGVVGLAIFTERGVRGTPEPPPRATAAWTPGEIDRRDTANPFPQRSYAAPPR